MSFKSINLKDAIFPTIILIAITFILAIVYSCMHEKSIFDITLEQWKSFVTIVYGAIALIFGYMYFIGNIRLQEENSRKNKMREFFEHIYNVLSDAKESVNAILNLKIKNEELLDVRNDLDLQLQRLSEYLEKNDLLLGFDSSELRKISSVHSYVVNSREITKLSFDELLNANTKGKLYSFHRLISEAKSICLEKMGSML